MWTSTMDLDQKKVLLTQLLGHFYQNIFFSSYSPLQVQNLPRQSLPESSWVRVRNRLSGICGSDLHLLFRGSGDQRVASAATPSQKEFYPGHEVVGEVIEVGDDVQRVHVGDRVVLQWRPNCITAGVQSLCHACSTGNYNLCDHGSFLSPPPLGGGWSEEMLLHEQQLFRVPSSLSDEQAVMLEPTAVATHAVLRHLPHPGERVLIIGAGTVGLLTQQVIRALVPQIEISVLARYPFQVEQATRMGASQIIYEDGAYEGIQRATNATLHRGILGNQMLQGGYDVIYDTIGQKRSWFRQNTLHHALRWVRSRGSIVLVGMSQHPMNIDLTPLWNQEISLLGSNSHGLEYWPLEGHEQTSTFRVVSELIQQRRITPEQLITHHFALDNYKNALLTAKNKAESRATKVVFDYSLLPASVVPNVRASAPRIRRQSTINFMERSGDEVRQSGDYPLNVPLTPGKQKEIPSAQPHTKELARKPKATKAAEEFDDDDTATALPVMGGRHATGDFRTYVPQSQMQGHVEFPHIQQEEPIPAQGPIYRSEDLELEDRTQRVSRSQLIPQTETELNLESDATTLFPRSSIPLSSELVSEYEQQVPEEPRAASSSELNSISHPELASADDELNSIPHPELASADDELNSIPHPELASADDDATPSILDDIEEMDQVEEVQPEALEIESVAVSSEPASPIASNTEEPAGFVAETPSSDLVGTTLTEHEPAQDIAYEEISPISVDDEQKQDVEELNGDPEPLEPYIMHDENSYVPEPQEQDGSLVEENTKVPEPQNAIVSPDSGSEDAETSTEQSEQVTPVDQAQETPVVDAQVETETPSTHQTESVAEEGDAASSATISSTDTLQEIEEAQTPRVQAQRPRNRKKRAGSR
ncbi:hypothetical protein KDW_17240 [Dictyobacter vulcani]|uniref:Enoyl reductase (ER) domain-containing protein n=1 Tax=Dictyobacter vulcani TaxID=2607529 RepID=A0A5J4KKH7_9CHLR|nr:medium chain dehydrogenase/reductase family protein [Dictyobacter vulcani]GER87562.1 hypothetical protein KDW_17240 [Dictyobacter vulcani]